MISEIEGDAVFGFGRMPAWRGRARRRSSVQSAYSGFRARVTHRLLKNSITDQTGLRGYLFLTTTAAERLALSPEIGTAHEERYDDVEPVTGIVVGLDASAAAAT